MQDNGPEPVLRPGAEDNEIKLPEEGEEPIEGVHYRYSIDYNLLIEGEDYDIVERGPFTAVWNLPERNPRKLSWRKRGKPTRNTKPTRG